MLKNVFSVCLFAVTLALGSIALAQPALPPVVARDELELKVKEEVVDVIEQGELLTVLEEAKDSFLVQTHTGRKARIAKVNVASLADSVDIYNKLIKLNPEAGRLYTLRASAWYAKGDNEKALADFDKAIDLGYEEPHAFSSRGLFHAALGDYDRAVADQTKAIEKGDKTPAPLVNRAAAQLMKQNFDQALADYSKAIELSPNNDSLYYQRALAQKAAGSFDAANKDFEKALELNPKNMAVLMARGFLAFQQRDFEKAVADFSTAIELNPKNPLAYNNRGYNRMQLAKWVEALEDFEKAIELAPNYGLALQNKAWLLATAGEKSVRKPGEAIRAATKACDLSKYQDITDISALAASLAADGQWEKAIGWQEKVIELGNETQKEFAKKILKLYEQKKPFDPKVGDTDEPTEPGKEGSKEPTPADGKAPEKKDEKKPTEAAKKDPV